MKFNPFLMRHLGVYYMLLASFYFSVTGAFAKILGDNLSSIEIVFMRNSVSLVIILAIFIRAGVQNFGHGGRPGLLIIRGVVGSLGVIATFYNITHIGLGEAITFQKTAPIFTAIFSSIFLKERLNSTSWAMIMFGFLGVVFIIQPHISIDADEIVGVLGGVFTGLAYTSMRELRKYYSTNAIILSFMVISVIATIAMMILAKFGLISAGVADFTMPSAFEWVLIVLMGACASYMQIYVTKSFAAAKKAGIVAAVGYADIILSTFFGLLLGDSMPNLITLIGILVIIISGVIMARQR